MKVFPTLPFLPVTHAVQTMHPIVAWIATSMVSLVNNVLFNNTPAILSILFR